MTFQCPCPSCGRANAVELAHVGKRVACGACGKPMKVEPPRETKAEPVSTGSQLKFDCPSCGRHYSTKPDLAGKKIRCSGCGAGVRVPGGEAVAASSKPALKTFGADSHTSERTNHRQNSGEDDSVPLLDALSDAAGPKSRSRSESILPSRSEAMEKVREQVAVEEAAKAQKQATKAKKKKRKKNTGFFDPKETMKLVGGVSVVVIGLGLLAWGVPSMRFPLGGILVIIGFIVYLLGWAAIKQHVAEEGDFKALMFRFIPPYQWWYVMTRWAETKDFVAFFFAGMIIMCVGGVVLKTSEIGQLAAKADARIKAREEAPIAGPPGLDIADDVDEQ